MGVSMHAMACGQGSTQNHIRGRRRGIRERGREGHTQTRAREGRRLEGGRERGEAAEACMH